METPVPQYEVNETETIQPEIISAEYIDVRKPLAKISQMVQSTMQEFTRRFDAYAEEMQTRIKCATETQYPYGFVRKPELRHQYGMLFNHHGYVI